MTNEHLTYDRQSAVQFAVSKETRTIRGLAVPFGAVGNNGFGSYRFAKGTLDWSKVKYLDQHNWSQAVGTVTFEETDEGLVMAAKIAPGARGDQILALTEPDADGDSVYDGLSIGLGSDARFEQDDDGVFNCISATVLEVSGTPIPAFADAQVRSVAASAAQNKEHKMTDTKVKVEDVETFSKADGDKLMEQVTEMSTKLAALEEIKIPVGPGNAKFDVKEEPIYRFAGPTGAPSGFDFATDLLSAAKDGDAAAFARIQKFTAEEAHRRTFADQPTTTGDTAAINPSQYRPDMFLGQAPVPTSPLYDFFHKGGLTDVTPFFWSKLDRANTDIGVSDHTEGTDPETRDLVTVAGTTVTPSPVSGKVHITREVSDQGGNPVVSGLIKNEFDRAFSIALETKTAALIAAAAGSFSALTTIAAGAAGNVAGLAIEGGLIDVGFRADGSRFEKMFGHVDLYKALALWENAEGEKRYPIINPQNRSGVTGDRFSFLEIAGYRMTGAASLGATSGNASNSYMADPRAVHVWNSGLTRLDKLQEKVEGWDLGVFAYFAGVVYDPTGMLKIAYDPTA